MPDPIYTYILQIYDSVWFGFMAYQPLVLWHINHSSILVTDYLTKMAINTVSQPPCNPDIAPCDVWLFPKLRGCRYETIEEMKKAVTKVIDTLRQEDFHGAFQKFFKG